MGCVHVISLLPLLIIAATSVVVLLAIAVRRNHAAAFGLTLAGLAAGICSTFFTPPNQATQLLLMDRYAFFFMGLLMAASLFIALLSYGYLAAREARREEFYVLLLVATLGAMTLTASSHFTSLFLGIEILSVALYGLIAYLRDRSLPLEAGIKYLVLAGSSSAFLAFGIALVYADLGVLDFATVAQRISSTQSGSALGLLIPGTVLILVGVGFKLALAPFHMWTPDVYEGAPAPVTAFVATVSKGGMFALLLRYFSLSGADRSPRLLLVLSIIAIASMLAGNLLALFSTNIKRILAYSSIAHMGYLLVAAEVSSRLGVGAGAFYLVAYFVMILGALGVVTLLSSGERDADRFEDYRGLFWRRPVLALIFTAMLLSLAGIPLTAGFLAKFYLVAAGADSHAWLLIFVLVVTSTIGLFYYLRVVGVMFHQPASERLVPEPLPRRTPAVSVVLVALSAFLIWFGVFPSPLLRLIQFAIGKIF
ncbi:MAG TPA: NADH-quinone oxidoreductase subunit N [Alloacidobacterium sp.]|jgi:NADH-quinone oxidoreductase subunit N|nr:NADH-quinone oxidoreductase subunit N [Alloacidobacterium sp.]